MRVDFHAHVLPGADHGSSCLETSLRQLLQARDAKIDLLAATPHFYPQQHSLSAFLQQRNASAAQLREAMPPDAPRLMIGAEVRLCNGLAQLDGLERLCFENTSTMLLELPPDFAANKYMPALDSLTYERHINIVLAHVDRYDPTEIETLFSLGYVGQLNASALCTLRTRARCIVWASGEAIVALGSDLHGVKMGYRPYLRACKYIDEPTIMQRAWNQLHPK